MACGRLAARLEAVETARAWGCQVVTHMHDVTLTRLHLALGRLLVHGPLSREILACGGLTYCMPGTVSYLHLGLDGVSWVGGSSGKHPTHHPANEHRRPLGVVLWSQAGQARSHGHGHNGLAN